jgi:hypothetical protein
VVGVPFLVFGLFVNPRQREFVGILTPHRNVCECIFARRQISFLMLQLGDEGGPTFLFVTRPPDFLIPFFKQMDLKLQLDVVHNQLIISARFTDKNGHTVATLDNGKWHVADSTSASWDFNYTDDALEVLNGQERVVLQIRVLPGWIQLQGESWGSDGTGIRIVAMRNPASAMIMHVNHHRDPDEPHIERIFTYPTRLNNLGRYSASQEFNGYRAEDVMCNASIVYGFLSFSARRSC